eukprot:IDg2938t1
MRCHAIIRPVDCPMATGALIAWPVKSLIAAQFTRRHNVRDDAMRRSKLARKVISGVVGAACCMKMRHIGRLLSTRPKGTALTSRHKAQYRKRPCHSRMSLAHVTRRHAWHTARPLEERSARDVVLHVPHLELLASGFVQIQTEAGCGL